MEEILDSLSKDDIAIRLAAVATFGSIPEEFRPELFTRITDDPNREVRQAAAKLIILCPIAFENYLRDVDPHVQVAAISNSVEVRKVHPNPASVLTTLTADNFIQNASNETRCAIARVLSDHAKLESLENARSTTIEKIVPVIDVFMRESYDDLRTATARSVNQLGKHFGTDFVLDKLHGSFHRMINDSQWRVRLSAIELLYGLAVVSTPDFFDQYLLTFFRNFLKDPCDRVRHFVLAGLPDLVERFGSEWLTAKFIVTLQDLARSNNFLHRESYLLAISSLADYFPEQYRSNYVFQPMIRMLRDQVSNVVAVALILLSEHLKGIHPFRKQYELRPILESLVTDAPQTTRDLARAFMNQFQ